DDGRILLVTGIGGRAGTAAALADETAVLLARIRIGDPVDAPSGTDAPVVLGDPPAAVAFAVPDGFRAAPFNSDSALAVLDTLPGAEAYIQVNIRLNTDASLTPALWKAQFFAGLADRVGDTGYDPETSWLPLTDEAEGAAVEVYRAVGLSDALSATAYLVTLSPRTFVVITALTPDAAALEAQAAALDALALSVRLFSGN
ncbi:MAG: hypothetical protein NZM00_05390, partial [Anaerolinea sp.]|nr:hypothetical protein [Anaerolinea sp.]